MFGMRHSGSHCEGRWAAGRHGRWGRHRHGFGGGRHGRGGDDMMRAGRMLAQGDLRLLALALIAEQPRHGYEIIKLLEEKTSGWYAPSPGIVYPTLTYLEEAGYVTASGLRRQEALHHHRRGPRLSRSQPRFRRRGAGAARDRWRAGPHAARRRRRAAAGAAPGAGGIRQFARGRSRAAQGRSRRRGQGGRGAGARRRGPAQELKPVDAARNAANDAIEGPPPHVRHQGVTK